MKPFFGIIRSSCRGCHGVCQILVHLDQGKIISVSGDPDSPTSRGFICPKGKAAPEMLYHPDRVKFPLRRTGVRGANMWERISWETAICEMVDRFDRIRKESGSKFVEYPQPTTHHGEYSGLPFLAYFDLAAHKFFFSELPISVCAHG